MSDAREPLVLPVAPRRGWAQGQPARLWLFAERSALPLELLVGFLLGVATLAWGLVALLWRAFRRWPGTVPWPGPLTLRPDPDDAS